MSQLFLVRVDGPRVHAGSIAAGLALWCAEEPRGAHPTSAVVAELCAPERHLALMPTPDLTPREREVLALLIDGVSARETPHRMGVRPATARNHCSSLLAKLGAVGDRSLGVLRAIQLGMVRVEDGA